MKNMLKTVVEYSKSDFAEFIASILFIAGAFGLFYLSIVIFL